MTRLYADENFSHPVVRELRRLGYDVLTIQEDGRAEQEIPDDLVLERAILLQRAVLTLNRKDFMRLHKEDANHSGIVLCTLDNDFVGQAQRIHAVLTSSPVVAGEMLRVYRPVIIPPPADAGNRVGRS